LGNLIWDWRHYRTLFHIFIGAAYAFHITLTFQVLQTRQTDITGQGYLFSGVVIFLGNVCVLMFGVPLLTSRVGLLDCLGWWLENTGIILERLQHAF
jgi:hypothetical protein